MNKVSPIKVYGSVQLKIYNGHNGRASFSTKLMFGS